MKPTKLFHILFSLTVIVALVFAAAPMTPAHAMSASSGQPAVTGNHSVAPAYGIVVCRSITVWRHHHWVTIRVCHRVHPHDS